jgi:WD repeat and SOF domain-containing protein 1
MISVGADICRIFTTKFSLDGKYVLTGSDDTNIRLWKANASDPVGVVIIFCCLPH